MFGLGQTQRSSSDAILATPSTMLTQTVAPSSDMATRTLTVAPSAVAPRAIAPAPSAVETRAVGPAYDYSRTSGGGGGQQTMTDFATSTFQAPTCLSAAQVAYLVDCAANPGSEDCQALLARAGMPLCAGDVLPLPTCRDAYVQSSIAYCDQYGPNGPDAGKNGVCWAAGKDPEWYQSMKALPACPGSSLEQAEKKNTLMWGGILLAIAVVGGGLYWYTKKK